MVPNHQPAVSKLLGKPIGFPQFCCLEKPPHGVAQFPFEVDVKFPRVRPGVSLRGEI